MPLTGRTRLAVAVLVAAAADAWATGPLVLGRSGAKPAQDGGVEFLIYFVEGGRLATFESAGMSRYR